jgi:DNA-binding CsgD family transcriptional regulator
MSNEPQIVKLTPRLFQTANLMIQGLNVYQIAAKLGITSETATTHKYSVLRRCTGSTARRGIGMPLKDFLEKIQSEKIKLVEYLPANTPISDEILSQIFSLRSLGHSISQIAEILGVSRNKVAITLREQRSEEFLENNHRRD